MASAGLSSIVAVTAVDPFEEDGSTITDGTTIVDVGDLIRRAIQGTYLITSDGGVSIHTYPGLDVDDIDEINAKL